MTMDLRPQVRGQELREDRAFRGLTYAQEAYCQARARGSTQIAAYRHAHPDDSSLDVHIGRRAREYEADSRICARIRLIVEDISPKTNLVPLITRDFVQQGIAEIATNKAVKDNTRLRAFELLGKMPHIGLFKDDGAPPDKTRSLEEVERELKEKLASILTVEGEARRVTPVESSGEPVESSGPPAKRDRRRKPHD